MVFYIYYSYIYAIYGGDSSDSDEVVISIIDESFVDWSVLFSINVFI